MLFRSAQTCASESAGEDRLNRKDMSREGLFFLPDIFDVDSVIQDTRGALGPTRSAVSGDMLVFDPSQVVPVIVVPPVDGLIVIFRVDSRVSRHLRRKGCSRKPESRLGDVEALVCHGLE